MITLYLKGNENQSRYWMHTIPDHLGGRFHSIMHLLKIDPFTMEKNCLLVGFKPSLVQRVGGTKITDFSFFEHLVGEKINLHEAKNLFYLLDSLTYVGMKKYSGLVAGQGYDIKDMINVFHNMDDFRLYDRKRNYRDKIEHNLLVQEHYDGISLPPVPCTSKNLILAKLISANEPQRFYFLYLPAFDRDIETAYRLIGCNSLNECRVEYFSCRMPPDVTTAIIEQGPDFNTVNKACWDLWKDHDRVKELAGAAYDYIHISPYHVKYPIVLDSGHVHAASTQDKSVLAAIKNWQEHKSPAKPKVNQDHRRSDPDLS